MKSFLVYTLSLHKCAIAGLSITCMRVWVSFSGLIILHFSYNHYGPSVSCWSTLCTDFFPLFALSTLLTVLSTSPSIFLCMLLLNVPSTWWPLCVNSQMQLKVVCVFVLFFIISPCNLKVAWLQIVALLSYLWNHGHCTLLQYAFISLTVCLLSKHITIMAIDAILRVLCHLYVCSL